MKQFIKDNRPYSQTDREDLIPHYLSQGAIEVPILYNGGFLNPLWNGIEWIEGATPEEIAEANKPIVQNLNLQQYEELLPTDWYYTRYIETGQEIPLEIKQQRKQIKDKYDTLIQGINNE